VPRIVLALAVLAFTVYCVVDAVQTEEDRVRNLPKVLWVFVTLLLPVAGGIAWLVAGRPRSILDRRPQPPRRGPLGPDDDPDFLRGL
jgi:hypothetical protein